MSKTEFPATVRRAHSSPMRTPVQVVKKQQSCRECKVRAVSFKHGCKRDNCGKCKHCLDMVAFGGTGHRKAKCLERVCEKMTPTPKHGKKNSPESPKSQPLTPTQSQKNSPASPKMQPVAVSHGHKGASRSLKLKAVRSAPSLKGKELVSKASDGEKTKESSKTSPPLKKTRQDENKTRQVTQKVKPSTKSIETVATSVEKSPKKITEPKEPQQSPKSKTNNSMTGQTRFNVKPINKSLPSPQTKLGNIQPKLEGIGTPQKNPEKKSENATMAPQRSSTRIRAIAQTGAEKSPKVKLPLDEKSENDNLETKTTNNNLQTSMTGIEDVSQKEEFTKRKGVENYVKAKDEKQNIQDTKTKNTAVRELKTNDESKGTGSEIRIDCGSSSSEKASSVTTKKELDLPTLKLDSMTKSELKEFIPKLLKLVTGKEEVFYSRRSAKPEWWPEDVTWAASRSAWYSEKYWTDNLRSVVKSCYKHVGREDLLQSFVNDSNVNSRSSETLGSEDTQDEENIKTGPYPSSPVKIRMFPQGLFLPFSAEIYICFFCEKEFLSKETMRAHQKCCKERPPDLQKACSDVSLFDTTQSVQPPAMSPKKSVNTVWSKLSLDKFTGHLGLVPKLTAAKLREQRPSVEEVNCEILDDIEPVSPVTPKTPKSLISQLSRDDSAHASRKRLSYSISMESHKEEVKVHSDSESDSDSEYGKDQKPVHEMNLLDIPISSLLGQRVKKYVHADTPMSIVEDTSSFCRTPVKNTFLEKLRKKPLAYPIIYRPRRIANLHKQNHLYRFKKAEVKEFMCKINTGLNSASIAKLQSMKKFSIRLLRLSRKRLLNWMSRRTLDKQLKGVFKGLKYTPCSEVSECDFPAGPTLLAKNIDKLLGLKKRTSKDSSNMSLSLSNLISEEMEAEVSKQKLTLYRSLLYEMSVLKPAVVMEDIHGQGKPSQSDSLDKSSGVGKTTGTDNLVAVEEKEVKARSIFRDVCRRSREERLIAEVEERERKDGYQTLKYLLMAPKQQESFKSVLAVPGKSPVSQVFAGVKNVKRSPNDDTVSIMSGSSEGESLLSNCCQGCSDKKHRVVNQGSAKMDGGSEGQSCVTPFIEPLHVDVGNESTPKIDDYGIPSPMSLSSESPFPPTPSKSSSGLLDEGEGMGFVKSPSLKRETRSTRSSGLLSLFGENKIQTPKNRPVFSLTSSKSESRIREPETVKSSLQRFQSEGVRTRSCSATPSTSPVKMCTRSGSSAPSSPNKTAKLSKFPLDITQISRKLEIPAAVHSFNSEVRFKLRSGTTISQSDSGRCDSPQKPKCSGSSPQINAVATNKFYSGSSSLVKTVMNKNTDRADPSLGDSPLRRSKRRSSFLTEDAPPSKLQKVHSDISVHSR